MTTFMLDTVTCGSVLSVVRMPVINTTTTPELGKNRCFHSEKNKVNQNPKKFLPDVIKVCKAEGARKAVYQWSHRITKKAWIWARKTTQTKFALIAASSKALHSGFSFYLFVTLNPVLQDHAQFIPLCGPQIPHGIFLYKSQKYT